MPQRVEGSIEVDAPVQRVYEYWETLENLPDFMSNVDEVRTTGPDTTHWRIRGPLGTKVEFDARTTQREPNEAIGWNSTDGDVGTSGQVRFRDLGNNRTRVEVQMNYSDPPGGKVGETASKLISNPQVMMQQDLANFKAIMEGRATPDEIQKQPSAASAQSGALAFLTSGAGLLTVGGLLILFLLLRRGGSRGGRPRTGNDKFRIILEF